MVNLLIWIWSSVCSFVLAIVDVFHWEKAHGADSCAAAPSSAAWHFS